jgi:cation diffusion facilitator family transporter
MHSDTLSNWQHPHVFLGEQHQRNERRVWLVVALTAAMMTIEIVGGTVFGSLALVADGWHMSTHAAALAISALAYAYSRRHVHDPRFAFGTGKLGDLAGFTSAVVLAMIALLIGYESITRLLNPQHIDYEEAIAIACVGLVVNLVSAWMLRDDHQHGGNYEGDTDHHHSNEHGHAHHHASDLNLRSAFVHVLADAATSVLAIGGLTAASLLGWSFIDPAVGLVGAIVILSWAWSLVHRAGAVLIDRVPEKRLAETVRKHLEIDGDKVADLHLWRVGPGHNALVLSIVSDHPQAPAHYKARLAELPGLSHVTVEVQRCPGSHLL